ncbi:MAG: response regulator [Salinisphaera sp.]|nr:response regulator [Salinisphaera sp.]
MDAEELVHGDASAATILVIDDSQTVRRSAETLLAEGGYTVLTAVDGFDALAKVVDHHPRLVLVDAMMPRLDGFQTCTLIRNNPVYDDVSLVMLTSKDGLFDRARAQVAGADRYLVKPFTREALLDVVAALV